ncbi:PTS fructose transporter subunit IIABC [Arenivirga flava]|uniref:PTS lactose transporter subunit IIC n=1 Tax=Arenivirga flava TaxID=1930060 RepID=A0AA37UGZ0_9MICO|nr:fructose-specific PTS transporter subunit EIIC [Arenivirga flava]GMA29305.1 PTS lactose transporter subunit IIC [Arenivirga flava]
MSAIITPALVVVDADLGGDRQSVIRALADRVVAAGRATETESLFADAWKREQLTDTGVPGGLAIPHCRSESVSEPTLAFARLSNPVDFGSADGPADLVFLIAAPAGADQAHLALLSSLARSLVDPDYVARLRSAGTPEAVVELVDEALAPEEAETAPAAPAPASGRRVIVGVTACPTGIAHTYMAADALVAAGERAGVDVHIETQGSSGTKPLDPALIAAADAVVFAVDVDVRDRARFAGKPVVQAPVKRGVDDPDGLIRQALEASTDPAATRVAGSAEASASAPAAKESAGAAVKRWLLTGVSYMIPFVAGGGLLIALGFLLAGFTVTDDNLDIVLGYSLWNLPPDGLGDYLGAVAFTIGGASMGFLVSALAGYIAYAMADRPGIAPGFVAGAIAATMGAGFLGGIVGGLLAGATAWALGRLNVARFLRGLMPVVIIPLLGSIVASGLLLLVLGGPIAGLTTLLNDFLSGLSGTGAVLLGLILGTMMAFDLGGPVNKVAYSFAVAGLGAGSLENQAPWIIMAAVMGAGMVPPLAMALASLVAPRLFTPVERENGKAAWLLGAAFISEGAIPFAVADVFRVIPASIVGSAVTGAMLMGFGVTSQAPHGGIFVFFAMNNFPLFALSVVVGAVITAGLVIVLKAFVRRSAPVAAAQPEAVAV